MRTLVSLLLAAYLGLNFIVFVFHPLSGAFLSLSHIVMPAGIVDGRAIWYPRVATFAEIARAEDPSMKKRDAVELGLQEAVYEARVKNILRTTHAAIPPNNAEDPVLGVIELSRAANTAVLASTDLQLDVRLRLDGLRSRIVDDGLPFTDAAMRYSEHSSARLNGDLGEVSLIDAPDWMQPIFEPDEKAVSESVNGPSAYWLFLVQSFANKDTQDASARVYGIAFQKKQLPAIITKSAKNDRPWVFVW